MRAQTRAMTTAEVLNARPRDEAHLEALLGSGWPTFISADRLAGMYLLHVRERIQRFELVVLDEGIPVVAGWAVPITWGGTRDDLPAGSGEASRRGLDEETRDGAVATKCRLHAQQWLREHRALPSCIRHLGPAEGAGRVFYP